MRDALLLRKKILSHGKNPKDIFGKEKPQNRSFVWPFAKPEKLKRPEGVQVSTMFHHNTYFLILPLSDVFSFYTEAHLVLGIKRSRITQLY